jgi:hypothetical protein
MQKSIEENQKNFPNGLVLYKYKKSSTITMPNMVFSEDLTQI